MKIAIVVSAGLFASALLAAPAVAQLSLPGAVPAAPSAGPAGAPADPTKPKAKPKPKPRDDGPVRAPGDETVVDRSLLHNGYAGRLELERRDKTLAVVKLTLPGDAMSKAGQACKVEALTGGPIVATAVGKPKGLARYQVALPGCDFSFDVLDGAVRVEPAQRVCEFAAADCRVDMSGLWGPPAASLGGERAREIEKTRARAEASMRAHFKTLVGRTSGKDAVKLVAREQAAFSSQREMICRDYQLETKHGFCGSRVTEARAAELWALLGAPAGGAEGAEAKPKKPKKPKPKPAAPVAGQGFGLPPAF
ncbi:MAG: hypothetical protein IPL88_01875 [Rhizobiales bacterium]|nr:hypothetical protein [Hyphomicrobiales bacterium]